MVIVCGFLGSVISVSVKNNSISYRPKPIITTLNAGQVVFVLGVVRQCLQQ
jgi:hypothetical protein